MGDRLIRMMIEYRDNGFKNRFTEIQSEHQSFQIAKPLPTDYGSDVTKCNLVCTPKGVVDMIK